MMKKFTKGVFFKLITLVSTLGLMSVSNNLSAQYCTPGYSSGCSFGATIDGVVTTGGIVNIDNTSTDCGPEIEIGYVDYTSSSTVGGLTATFGSTINFTVDVISFSGAVKIWIDLDGDGTFSTSELMAESPSIITAGTSYSGSFTIPVTASATNTRMRVRVVESTTAFDACSTHTYGETEDYSVTLIPDEDCASVGSSLDAGSISGIDSICPSIPFNLSLSGASIISDGISQWQSSTAPTGPFVNIPGATGFSYVSPGITANTYYRYYISCSGGFSDTSAPKLVSLKSFVDCYCDPVYTSGCISGATINDFFTSGAILDISNLSSGCGSTTGLGYSDYTGDLGLSGSALKGVPFNATVGVTNYSGGVKIWIDYNHSGTFDTDELVLSSPSIVTFGDSYSNSINIPTTALDGPTRMRVRVVESSTTFDPCSIYTWGETEDYLIDIITPVSCATSLLPMNTGDVVAVDSICPSIPFGLSTTGGTIAFSGITYQWQSSNAAAGPFVNIPGATSLFYLNPGITTPTYYRLVMTCESGSSDTSDVHFVNISSFMTCYCEPEYLYGCTFYTQINDFFTTSAAVDISNMGTGCSPSVPEGYTNYASEPDFHITAIKTVPFLATVGITNTEGGVKAWIDYNHNGIFDDTEIVMSSPTTVFSGLSYSETITVPASALEGPTMMRVRSRSWSTVFGPCGEEYFGEAEDYLINIVNPIPCTEAEIPTTIAASAIPNDVCIGDRAVLKLATELPIAFGYTYQWKYGTSPTGPFTFLTVDPQDNSTQISHNITTPTYYVLDLFCEGSLIRSTAPILITPITPSTTTAVDNQICGPGIGTLTGSTASGSLFWYDGPTSATPLFTGATFTTPLLTTSTTYYVASGAFPSEVDSVGDGYSISNNTDNGPFNMFSTNNNVQLVYTKSQLNTAGVTAGKISKIAFYAVEVPTAPLTNYNISWKQDNQPLPLVYSNMDWIPALTGGVVAPATEGWYEISLPEPIYWNGESNLLLNICYQVPTGMTGSVGTHRFTNKTGQMVTRRSNTGTDPCDILATTFNSSKLPNIKFIRDACESERVAVTLHVRDTPVVNIIEEDGTYCMDLGSFQINTSIASSTPVTYLWNTGAVTPILNATASGTYHVTVTNAYGCTNSDTAVYTLNPSPVVSLGPDKIVCADGDLTLDASGSGAASYYWNTGATTPDINITTPGTYIVFVTNSLGCIGSDTVNVTVSGLMPYMAGINVNAISPMTFGFSAILPSGIISYSWDFGDGSAPSYSANPIHTYATPGTYDVRCTVNSVCGTRIYKTFATTVTTIGNDNVDNSINIFPNPANTNITIESKNSEILIVKVVNAIGQEIGIFKDIKGRNTKIDVNNIPSGNYFLIIETKEGISHNKFTIAR